MSSQTSGPLVRGAGAGCASTAPPPGIVAIAAAPWAGARNRRGGSLMVSRPEIHALPAPHIRTGVGYDACRNARRGDVAYWPSFAAPARPPGSAVDEGRPTVAKPPANR